jgi:ribonuclease P protein component
MLRSREDFARLGAQGRTRTDRLLVVHFVPNHRGHDRYGISTGRRLGGAVTRNRVRRRLREILRAEADASERGWDVLVVARPASASASFSELRAALVRLLAAVRGTLTSAS